MNLQAIEAFARGAMSALLAESKGDRSPSRPRRRGHRTAPLPATAPHVAEQLPLIDAPGASADLPAPPLTQVEYERMERVLRGEAAPDSYVPGEGVAPWMES